MSGFTTRQIVHIFVNGDQTPASGAISFVLSKRMTNAGTTILPMEITANLSGSGVLAQTLTPNDDPGTIPVDAEWLVTMRIAGQETETFAITLPNGAGTIDLGTLLPQGPLGG